MSVNWSLAENSVELGYFAIYLILAFISLRSFRRKKSNLALFFCLAFISLAFSGLYGGLDYFVKGTTLEYEKINEVYEGLQFAAVVFFGIGITRP